MSWKLTGIISQKRVGSTARKLLLLSMADKANDDGAGVYASFSTLADMCEASRPTVKRLIKEFIDNGLIRHVGLRQCRNGSTNEYDLDVEAIEALPDVGEEVAAPAKRTRSKANPVHGEPGSGKTRSTATPNPVHGDPTTGVMVTPKPILKPIQEPLFKGVQGGPPTDDKPKQKGGKHRRGAYTPTFEAFWSSWPKTWRERSDKQLAFKRWKADLEQWPVEEIMAAARGHIDRNKRDGYRYCGRADVFLNGKLEAAIEAVNESVKGETREVWDDDLKTWVERAA